MDDQSNDTLDFAIREARIRLKHEARLVKEIAERAKAHQTITGDKGEIIANLMLSYRHLEDASMRLGKAQQALDGGVSVYDRESTVGA